MGLFDKLKSKQDNFSKMITELSHEVITLYSDKVKVPFKQTTELERQVLAIYLFGMFDGLRQDKKVQIVPEQIVSDISNVLVNIFNYSNTQAETFVNEMIINLQSNNLQNTYYAIIHRGLDGYYAWNNSKDKVIEDIIKVINLLQG